MTSGNHAVRRGFNTKYAAFTGVSIHRRRSVCVLCPEDAISAAVAPVVDGVFVDILLGFALRVCRRDALVECCLLVKVVELDVG